jgi:hypothetical protein
MSNRAVEAHERGPGLGFDHRQLGLLIGGTSSTAPTVFTASRAATGK